MNDTGTIRPTRPLCPARWSRTTRGYIEIRDPFTGEVHEISFRDATPVWKDDVRTRRGGDDGNS